MKRPQSNGLFEVTGGQEKERGFCCMKLITFLSANNVTDCSVDASFYSILCLLIVNPQ